MKKGGVVNYKNLDWILIHKLLCLDVEYMIFLTITENWNGKLRKLNSTREKYIVTIEIKVASMKQDKCTDSLVW